MIKKTAAFAVWLLLCLSCNNNKSSQELADLNQEIDKSEKDVSNAKQAYGTAIAETTDSTYQQVQEEKPKIPGEPKTSTIEKPTRIDWDKKIVKTAILNVEVKDYKSFSKELGQKTTKYGGYISNEQQTQSEYKIENTITIKVPVDQFENALNDILADASKTIEKRITSDDVTTELIDGRSRLEAKRQVRLRYLDLLKQAKNMEEIFQVQKEINGIQEEMELVNGRINMLNHSSAMSTIQLTFAQILNPQAIASETKEAGFLAKAKAAFVNGWYWMGELFVGLLSIWPLILAVVFGIVLIRRQIPKPATRLATKEPRTEEHN